MERYEFGRVLTNGRIRWYKKFRVAKKPGQAIGARMVVEKDSATGTVLRVWNEVYDRDGRVIEVHPKQPKDLGHLKIDPDTGKEISRRP